MKIVCLIDNLNSGGAQRQLVMLACLLKEKKYEVKVISYYPQNHFKHLLEEFNVEHLLITENSQIKRAISIRKAIQNYQPQALIAFSDTPSLLAIFSTIFFKKFKLVVSERYLQLTEKSLKRTLLRLMYPICDAITTNSFANAKTIKKFNPLIKSKVHTIYNVVDLSKFNLNVSRDYSKNKFIVVASFRDIKNPLGLINAVGMIRYNFPEIQFTIDWYGHSNAKKNEDHSDLFRTAMDLIFEKKLDDIFNIKDPILNLEIAYGNSSVLLLTSFAEGFPNVVCEAMASGLPILASNVSDLPSLLQNQPSEMLFDPTDCKNIAKSILFFLSLSIDDRTTIGEANRIHAHNLFQPDKYVESYLSLLV